MNDPFASLASFSKPKTLNAQNLPRTAPNQPPPRQPPNSQIQQINQTFVKNPQINQQLNPFLNSTINSKPNNNLNFNNNLQPTLNNNFQPYLTNNNTLQSSLNNNKLQNLNSLLDGPIHSHNHNSWDLDFLVDSTPQQPAFKNPTQQTSPTQTDNLLGLLDLPISQIPLNKTPPQNPNSSISFQHNQLIPGFDITVSQISPKQSSSFQQAQLIPDFDIPLSQISPKQSSSFQQAQLIPGFDVPLSQISPKQSSSFQQAQLIPGFDVPIQSTNQKAPISYKDEQVNYKENDYKPPNYPPSIPLLSNNERNLQKISNMGFNRSEALIALESSGNDLDMALAMLLSEQEERDRRGGRKVSFYGDDVVDISTEKRRNNHVSTTKTGNEKADLLLNTATSIGMQVFSNAKSVFQISKKKITSLAQENGIIGGGSSSPRRNYSHDESSAHQSRYRDDDNYSTERTENIKESSAAPNQSRYRDEDSSDDDEEPIRFTRASDSHQIVKEPFTSLKQPKNQQTLSLFQTLTLSPSPFSSPKMHHRTPSPPPIPTKPAFPTLDISFGLTSQLENLKAEGNKFYKSGDYVTSEIQYTKAIETLQKQTSNLKETQHTLTSSLFLNRAQTRLKTGFYNGATEDATFIIQACDVGNAYGPKELKKGLERRAEAFEKMEKFALALGDYRRLLELGVVNSSVGSGTKRCLKALDKGGEELEMSVPKIELGFDTFLKPRPQVSNGEVFGKPVDPYIKHQVDKAVTALRAQNEENESIEAQKLSLKDQVDFKIEKWQNGKKDNLRALLSSLETILWPSLNWKNITLAELIQPSQVKVRYMKAVSKLHPDKLGKDCSVEQVMIAAAAFSTLNESWDKFKTQNNLN